MKTSRRLTTFEIEYYKPSGKLYCSDRFDLEVTFLDDCHCVYMNDVVEHVKTLRAGGSPMPGLSACWSEGPIRVDCPEFGFPVLIL